MCVSLKNFKFGDMLLLSITHVQWCTRTRRDCSFINDWSHFAKIIVKGIRKFHSWPVGETAFGRHPWERTGGGLYLVLTSCQALCWTLAHVLPHLSAHSTGRQGHHRPLQCRWLVPDHATIGAELLQMQVILPTDTSFFCYQKADCYCSLTFPCSAFGMALSEDGFSFCFHS